MKSKKALLLIGLLLVVLAVVLAGCGGNQPQGGEQEQPQAGEQQQQGNEGTSQGEGQSEGTQGSTEFTYVSSDEKPEACASCHVKNGDEDYTLQAEIQRIEGHPQVTANSVKECMACHSENGPGPAFKQKLHWAHLVNKGDENHFVSNYGGACVQCHKAGESGAMIVKGLEEAGTKFVPVKSATVDLAENGCASCHVKNGDKDYTLQAEIQRIEGHPQVTANSVKECIACHSENGPGPAFREKLHQAHLINKGDENHFVSNYGGSCRNCHAIGDDGSITVKGL